MTSPAKRYISLWLPKWSIECRLGVAISGPLIQTIRSQNKVIIQALNGEAEGVGLQPGMSLATARAICSGLAVEDYTSDHNQRCLVKLADWALAFTPYVACDGVDGLIMDVTGCPLLFGGEEDMLEAFSQKLSRLGHQHNLAMADTSAASWALSHFGKKPLIIQTSRLKDEVTDLPVEALRLPHRVVNELGRMGLRLISDILPIPRASLAVRYGMEVAVRLDQLLGHMPEPIQPRPHQSPHSVRLRFPDAIGLTEDVEVALDRLIKALCQRLEDQAMGTTHVQLICERANKSRQMIAIGIGEATNSPAHIKRLFQEKINEINPGFGIDAMRLIAPMVEAMKRRQSSMAMPVVTDWERGKATERAELHLLMDHLRNRLGANAVGVLRARDSHLPDQAQGWNSPKGHNWPETPPRPSLLLKRPQSLSLLSQSPDNISPRIIRHHGQTHQIAKTWGPERISPDWWRRDGDWQSGARDYYRVETVKGEQLWIYRESQSQNKNWFLHGWFS